MNSENTRPEAVTLALRKLADSTGCPEAIERAYELGAAELADWRNAAQDFVHQFDPIKGAALSPAYFRAVAAGVIRSAAAKAVIAACSKLNSFHVRELRNAFYDAHRQLGEAIAAMRPEDTGWHERPTPEQRKQLVEVEVASRALNEACDAIPDITLSGLACRPGAHWNRVHAALRELRKAQGFDPDAYIDQFDRRGWLLSRQRKTEGNPQP